MFPLQRPRRLREFATIRSLVRETSVDPSHLIYPMFVSAEVRQEAPISAMPGVSEHTLDSAMKEIEPLYERGLRHFLLFGIPDHKDAQATGAYEENGIVQRTIRKVKQLFPESVVFTDVCLCHYTDTGHCGVTRDHHIHNDASVELLVRTALSHAQAGADFISPSDMMDGRVLRIRQALDQSGLGHVGIMAYSAKFASGFYGPFREAAHSAPQFGDRKSHQMDPANRREALKEMELDLEEGADILMVKPALSYLDIIREAADRFLTPIAAYNVSGEYSMVKAAGQKGWIDEKVVRDEILLSIRRAGADIIITYFAKDIFLEKKH